MDNVSARVSEEDGKHFIVIDPEGDDIRIPMSEEKPTDVKRAFNRLIVRLKAGPFVIQLEDLGGDLFSEVAEEYVKQLNGELREVRAEMVKFGLATE